MPPDGFRCSHGQRHRARVGEWVQTMERLPRTVTQAKTVAGPWKQPVDEIEQHPKSEQMPRAVAMYAEHWRINKMDDWVQHHVENVLQPVRADVVVVGISTSYSADDRLCDGELQTFGDWSSVLDPLAADVARTFRTSRTRTALFLQGEDRPTNQAPGALNHRERATCDRMWTEWWGPYSRLTFALSVAGHGYSVYLHLRLDTLFLTRLPSTFRQAPLTVFAPPLVRSLFFPSNHSRLPAVSPMHPSGIKRNHAGPATASFSDAWHISDEAGMRAVADTSAFIGPDWTLRCQGACPEEQVALHVRKHGYTFAGLFQGLKTRMRGAEDKEHHPTWFGICDGLPRSQGSKPATDVEPEASSAEHEGIWSVQGQRSADQDRLGASAKRNASEWLQRVSCSRTMDLEVDSCGREKRRALPADRINGQQALARSRGRLSKPTKLAVFWTVGPGQFAQEIVAEQLRLLNTSGLAQAASAIYVSGLDFDRESSPREDGAWRSLFNAPKLRSLVSAKVREAPLRRFAKSWYDSRHHAYEFGTLESAWDFCSREQQGGASTETAILYMHTKGSTHKSREAAQVSWRRNLNHFTITRYADCLAWLSLGYATCGPHLQIDSHILVRWPHYSGNFWWARCEYIRRLPSPRPKVGDLWERRATIMARSFSSELPTGRWLAEAWLLRRNSSTSTCQRTLHKSCWGSPELFSGGFGASRECRYLPAGARATC
eukprot:5453163-Prymnesium_polylepis.1